MRVVLDSNVLVAAFASRGGVCGELYRACLRQHGVLISEYILEEVRRNLPAKVKLTLSHTDAIVASIRRSVAIVEPEDVPTAACRDPDDLPILGTAVAARADCLVTGDADLLELREFQGIPILSPREFLECVQ